MNDLSALESVGEDAEQDSDDDHPAIERRGRIARHYASIHQAPESLHEWMDSLPRLRDLDHHHLIESNSEGFQWVEPESEPLVRGAPDHHRSGLSFENESEAMRAACVDTIGHHLDAETVVHEVRHQYNGYHTDLVYADLDDEAAARRFALAGGTTRPVHDPVQRFKVWWYLRDHGPMDYEDAIGNGGRYANTTENRKHTDWLLDNGYAARTPMGFVTAVVPEGLGDLHAVELKLRDWKTALEQADRANRSDSPEWRSRAHHDKWGYADYRWVALDAAAVGPALDHREAFHEKGVGLLAITESGSVIQHIDAEHEPRGVFTRDRAYVESQVWASLDTERLAERYDAPPHPEQAESKPEQSSLSEVA